MDAKAVHSGVIPRENAWAKQRDHQRHSLVEVNVFVPVGERD